MLKRLILVVIVILLALPGASATSQSVQLRGVGVPSQTEIPPAPVIETLGQWWYDWGGQPIAIASGFVPMSLTGGSVAPSSSYILVYNEPELPGDGNMTPALAAERYRILRQDYLCYNPDLRFIVGGIVGNAGGINWCNQFINSYGSDLFRCDGWHFHVYTGGDWPAARTLIQGYVAWWKALPRAVAGSELWITEIGVLETGRDIAAFMRSFLAFIPTVPEITRYAWFATRTGLWGDPLGSLVDASGQLTALGMIWAGTEPEPTATPSTSLPVCDAWVSQWAPTQTHATGDLAVRTGGVYETWIRFNVGGAGTLRFYARSKSNAGTGTLNVYQASSNWWETTLTYATRPARGALVATIPMADVGRWYEAPVPTGTGTVVLVYESSASTEYWLASRDDATLGPRVVR